MGADAGMFAYGDYDEDDKEADEIYAHVEDVMDKRRKVRRCYAGSVSGLSCLHFPAMTEECVPTAGSGVNLRKRAPR